MQENTVVKPLLCHGGTKIGEYSCKGQESPFRYGRCNGHCKVEVDQLVDFTEGLPVVA